MFIAVLDCMELAMGWKCLFVGPSCLVSMARETEMDMQGWISNRFDLPMLKLHKMRERDLSGLHLELWSCKMLACS